MKYLNDVSKDCVGKICKSKSSGGFKLKEQPDGSIDLNPYVYAFADKLIKQTHISLLGDFKDMLAEINSEIDDVMLECK